MKAWTTEYAKELQLQRENHSLREENQRLLVKLYSILHCEDPKCFLCAKCIDAAQLVRHNE